MGDFIKEGFRKLKLHSPKMARCLSLYGIDLLTEPLRERVAELEAQLEKVREIHLNSNLSWQDKHIAIGELFLEKDDG